MFTRRGLILVAVPQPAQRAMRPDRTCPWCGGGFRPPRDSSVCCSLQCAQRFRLWPIEMRPGATQQ